MPVINTPEGPVNFPDSMSDDEIKAVLRKKFAPEKSATSGADIARAAAQGLTFGFADEIEAGLRSLVGPESYEEELKDVRSEVKRFREKAPLAAFATEVVGSLPTALLGGAGIARAAGQLAGRAPAVARVLQAPVGAAAAEGVLGGAIYGSGAAEEDRLAGAQTGAVLGGLLGGGTAAALPRVTQAAREMIRRDVPLTAGQALGGAPRLVEEAIAVLPFAGRAVEKARGRSISQYSRIATEDALAPVGLELPKGVTGSEAIDAGFKKMNQVYTDLAPQLKIKDAKSLRQVVKDTIEDAGIGQSFVLGDAAERALAQNIKNITKKLGNKKQLSGEMYHSLDKMIGANAAKLNKPQAQPDAQEVGRILRNIQLAMRDELRKQNKTGGAALDAANKAYSNLINVERAAYAAVREGGEFTPSQLLSKMAQQQKRKAARGQVEGQEAVLAAQDILGRTATGVSRPILEARPFMSLASAAGGAAAPAAILPAAAGLGAVSGAYSRLGTPVVREVLGGLGSASQAIRPTTVGLLTPTFLEE